MRAGTSLGNILLNVLISEGIPVERVGKNNVMVRNENKQKGSVCYLFDKQVICLPNPPIDLKADPQPTTFLIRFSTLLLSTLHHIYMIYLYISYSILTICLSE